MADKKQPAKQVRISVPVGVDIEIEHRDDEDVAGQENSVTWKQDKKTMNMEVNLCCH